MKEILITTYTICLPIIMGYIVSSLKERKSTKKSTKEAFENIERKIDHLTRSIDDERARASRYRIIRFDDELQQGIKHTKDHYDQILEDIDTYKLYCQNHPDFKNHKGQNAMRRILESENEMCKGGGENE